MLKSFYFKIIWFIYFVSFFVFLQDTVNPIQSKNLQNQSFNLTNASQPECPERQSFKVSYRCYHPQCIKSDAQYECGTEGENPVDKVPGCFCAEGYAYLNNWCEPVNSDCCGGIGYYWDGSREVTGMVIAYKIIIILINETKKLNFINFHLTVFTVQILGKTKIVKTTLNDHQGRTSVSISSTPI